MFGIFVLKGLVLVKFWLIFNFFKFFLLDCGIVFIVEEIDLLGLSVKVFIELGVKFRIVVII